MSTTQIHQKEIDQQPTIWTVSDELWIRLEPELIIKKTKKRLGRPRHSDRQIFNGLIHLARTGSQWSAFPREFAAKSTAFDRFKDWVENGAFQRAWRIILEEYDQHIGLEWDWQSADGCNVKAPLGKRGIAVKNKTLGVILQTEEK